MTIPTGFDDLDNILNGGLHPSSLVIIGGRPAMGKTSFMMNIAENLIDKGVKFLYFTLEMNEHSFVFSLLKMIAELENNISFDQAGQPDSLTGYEFQRLVVAKNRLENSHCYISSNKNFNEIIEEIQGLDQECKVVFVDYLQMLGGLPRYEEISKIIIDLKILANQKNICIIVASQLSRAVEERQGHRPVMTDFRDSGAIEEAADQILMLLRREYYDQNDKPGLAEIIVGKNRMGNTGTINMVFRKEIRKFASYTPLKFDGASAIIDNEESFSQFAP